MDPLDLSAYDVPSTPENVPDVPAENGSQEFESLGVDDDNLGVDESATAGVTRRPRAKMDSERILGKHGLPTLQKTMLRFKFKGKGHEKRDLIKLLGTYQLWGHKLYPKANFEDFLILCRRGGRDTAIKMYRKKVIDEEKYGSRHTALDAEDVTEQPSIDEPAPVDEPVQVDEPVRIDEPVPIDEHEFPDLSEFQDEEQDEDSLAAAMEAYEEMGF